MEENTDKPDYIFPIFFTTKTQEIFSCTADQDVTEEQPYKIFTKEQIQQDFRDRAAISDFHPAKKIIEDYPADELLIVYDAAFEYGQNFYLITDDEQKHKLLNPVQEDGGLGEDEETEIEVVRFGLRTPQPWLSMGSEIEVEDEMVLQTDNKVKFTIRKSRQDFGRPISLEDRIENESTKDIIIDCFSFEDSSYSIEKKELDVGIQNTAILCEQESQTEWPCPKNASVQCEARIYSESKNEEIMQTDDFVDFIEEVIPRFEFALQQNETLDVFTNDYRQLGEEESAFGAKSDNHLKEYQSFTDLQFSKNKTISYIQWHPNIKGVIAVSCIEHTSFYERIDQSTKSLMSPSLILVWSFADPIHPLLLLEAPDDILCFKFNPSDSNIICGGCINGQVVLWDIKKYSDLLKNHRSHGQGSTANQNLSNLPSFYNTNSTELSPIIRYCAVSSIENSHRMAITDIQWVPDHIEIGRMGVVLENKMRYCSQIITSSCDGHVLFWDTKSSKSGLSRKLENDDSDRITTFQHLDLSWKPLLKVTAHRIRGSGEYSPTRFSIEEVQSTAKRPDINVKIEEEEAEDFNQFSSYKKKDEPKTMDNIKTKFYLSTEDGEIVYLDWKPTKDIDTGKIVSTRPEFTLDGHDSAIYSLQKSPFIKEIFLTVGGWTFALWKDGITVGPLFQSYTHAFKLTCGMWSPTRPAVFFIGKEDGNVDIWDLLDKSHEPFLTQSVSPVPIITVYPYQMSLKQQLLAAGDEVGTLHVMEVPWNLRHATNNELSAFENYLDRETNRLQFLQNNKSAIPVSIKTNEDQTKSGTPETDEEWEAKAKTQYAEFLEMEKRLLMDMGLLTESME